MRGPAEEQEKTDKLKAMIQILQEKLTKVKRGRGGSPENLFLSGAHLLHRDSKMRFFSSVFLFNTQPSLFIGS
jgi:hypothetical protein